MAMLGEVKYKVIQAALILGQFTIRQIVQATNLHLESIESVIQRLQRDGYVNATGSVDESRKQRGKPPVVYSLSEDSAKREELLDMVDAFALEHEETHPYFAKSLRSSHFVAAKSLITSLERCEIEPSISVLQEVENHLSRVADDQELEDATPEIIRAHTDYQRGRLAFVQKDYVRAQPLFGHAYATFEANGLFRMAEECKAAGDAAEAFSVLEAAEVATDSLSRQQALAELEAKLRVADLPARPVQDLCIALARQALQSILLLQPRSTDALLQTWRATRAPTPDEEYEQVMQIIEQSIVQRHQMDYEKDQAEACFRRWEPAERVGYRMVSTRLR